MASTRGGANKVADAQAVPFRGDCGKCGARRIDAQLGLEATPEQYVANMVAVFREVRRVLRDDGTCWINLGDSYAGGGFCGSEKALTGKQGSNRGSANMIGRSLDHGLKPKDLVGVPWRVAFALQADGWYLRSDIIWHKPNPMPESVTDRPTKAHEYIFLLTKSAKYYYDASAIAEANAASTMARDASSPGTHQGVGKSRKYYAAGMQHSSGPAIVEAAGTRNKRTVWTVPTQPYPDAHFATYPEALIEPCILAGTSERGQCPACGSPWKRVVERTAMVIDRSERTHDKGRTRTSGTMLQPPSAVTIGWQPTCTCDAGDPVPQLVLDPFTGSGTTGAVAIRHGRSFVGCELNPQYLALARTRIGAVAPLLATEVA